MTALLFLELELTFKHLWSFSYKSPNYCMYICVCVFRYTQCHLSFWPYEACWCPSWYVGVLAWCQCIRLQSFFLHVCTKHTYFLILNSFCFRWWWNGVETCPLVVPLFCCVSPSPDVSSLQWLSSFSMVFLKHLHADESNPMLHSLWISWERSTILKAWLNENSSTNLPVHKGDNCLLQPVWWKRL